jgi:hypothetical protein
MAAHASSYAEEEEELLLLLLLLPMPHLPTASPSEYRTT